MKKTILFFTLLLSQFTFAQFPGSENIIYIECNGDSIAVDITEYQNMPIEILPSLFDCDNQDDWTWDNDDWNPNNPGIDNPGMGWDDSTDVDTPWGDEEDIQELLAELEMACASGDYMACGALELFAECTNGNSEACEELIGMYEAIEEEDDDDDNEWPWDNDGWDFDSTDVDTPWGDEEDIQELLEELQMACASGDYMACGALELFAECTNGNTEACEELIGIYESNEEEDDDDDNEWPWDNDGWDDSTDFDCPWEDGFPGAENNEGFDSAIFDNMMSLFFSMDMEEDEMVLIFEQSDVLISIIDASGIEFTPTLIDGYLVFGPFNIEDLYSIFMGDMNGNGIGWGLLRPSGAEVVADGVISEPSELLNGMFTISASLSLEVNTAPLEVYNTTYFNLLGKEIKTLDQGLYIKVMQTNKGQVAEKVYFRD